jgi:hypothetical protein
MQQQLLQQQAVAAAAAAAQRMAEVQRAQQAAAAAAGRCRAQGWLTQHSEVREALVQLCQERPEVAQATTMQLLGALDRCLQLPGGPAKALLALHCASLTDFSRVGAWFSALHIGPGACSSCRFQACQRATVLR